MCFSVDYEWYAEVQVVGERVAETEEKCLECGRRVTGIIHTIHMQEREECQNCPDGQCDEPDYGEVFDYRCCDGCWKLIKAIEDAEQREGCATNERSPPLCSLFEELMELDYEVVDEYLSHAESMFPEIKDYLLYARKRIGKAWDIN